MTEPTPQAATPGEGGRTPASLARMRAAYVAEMDSAWLYSSLAESEPNPKRRESLERMAADERTHASHWARQLQRAGETLPAERISARSRLLAWLGARFGPRAVAPFLAVTEREASTGYKQSATEREFSSQERDHARVFAELARGGGDVAGAERWHQANTLNVRAAVFGINDGVVSNLSLVAGVAAAQPSPEMVLLAGIAGLLAGACSMAGGEYISVKSQREMLEYQLQLEQMELEESPEAEERELARIYERKGLPAADAQRVAAAAIADPEKALDTLAREELGLNPGDLGSPTWAAGSSFVSFALGAFVPLAPYLFRAGEAAFGLSIAASALVLFAVGALLAVLSGRSPLVNGARMLAVGGVAATVTYLVGKLLGVAISA